jgi:hypothetical protein
MTIRFIKGYPPYHAGDRAGFTPEREKELIDEGVAKAVKKPTKDKMVKGSVNKMYECEYCGRKFDSPQGKGAHQRFCKEKSD